jgi:uncharacterized protein (TIRG00374 family)
MWLGLAIGLGCMYMAVRKIEWREVTEALGRVQYLPLIPCLFLVFLGHIMRALRWRILMAPLKTVKTVRLFSALMIGYVVNSITPAHLGELVRAYVLGKREGISASSVLATIVVERVIDIFSLLGLMLLAVFLYPFPGWVTKSGYLMLAGALALVLLLAALRRFPETTLSCFTRLAFFIPGGLRQRLSGAAEGFITGIAPLQGKGDYLAAAFLSAAIWACYGLIFHLCLYAFDFPNRYSTGWIASLLLLIITTIAVVVPSSPGYVGTYHYLCQLTLAMFLVPAGEALSFAALVHILNMLPVTLTGIACARMEGVAITGGRRETGP